MYTLPCADSATDPAPIRAMSGRQTLGSNHDGGQQHGPDSAAIGDAPRIDADNTRPVWWRMFVDRCATAAFHAEQRRTADRLIMHVETGWRHVAHLQSECERQHATHPADEDIRLAHLVGFTETEVIGSFIECADQITRFFSGENQSGDGLDVLCQASHRFERAVALCALASESAHVRGTLKVTLEQVANALLDWSADLDALVTAMVSANATR